MINGYGAVTVAGVAAAWRYFALMEVVGAGLDGAVAVYVGQNHGAGRRDRVRQGIRRGRHMALGGAVAVSYTHLNTFCSIKAVVKEMTMLPYSTQSSSMASVAPSLSEMGRTNSSPPIVRSRPSSTVKISIMVK